LPYDLMWPISYPGPAASLLSAVAAAPALSPHGEEALAPSRTMRPHWMGNTSAFILRDARSALLRMRRNNGTRVGFLFVLIVGLLAGTISGIVGTGSSIMLMPVLVYQYGPKQAVPIMAVAAVMANLSRILAWWRDVDWRACAGYSVTGVPAAALGARTLLALPSHTVDVAIGTFLI